MLDTLAEDLESTAGIEDAVLGINIPEVLHASRVVEH